MNRYSKIKIGNTKKSRSISRSMDFSDFQSFPDNYTKPIEPISPKSTYNRTQEEKRQEMKSSDTPNDHSSLSDVAEEYGHSNNTIGGSKFGLTKLTRNGSVSSTTSTASKRFKQQSSSPRTSTTKETVQSVVKRAFSMRRSSSVSERYCRIHDQCVTISSPFNDYDAMENVDAMETTTSFHQRKKKKKGLLKACKRFLGFE